MKTNIKTNSLDNLRHSTSHLLAAAILELYPDAKLAIGPSIENGFYYDIDFGDLKISEADFPIIEKKMHDLIPSWQSFKRILFNAPAAKKQYKNNPYKEELIDEFSEKGKKEVGFYESVGSKSSYFNGQTYRDLCKGGHIEKPSKEIKYFKLLSIAGAYWRGDEKNKMLTRIYGTVWSSQDELDKYIKQIEEAKDSDHRNIGKELDLFVFSDLVGKGLPLLTAKGSVIRRELERFVVDEELRRGYLHVYTPPVAKTELYKTSGHYPYYKDTMYPVMKVDDDELILRPMTCPHHFMLYASHPRSYKELPIKFAEISPQFRYEKSGELSGLMRVRTFILTDAHIIVAKEQAENQINEVLALIDFMNEKLGLKKGIDYRYRLSLGDRKDNKKYYKDDKSWEFAESVLRKVLKESKSPYFEAEGEAAFYGPKIDVQVKKVNGSEETAFTVQYDFVMPKRFKLKFINKDGAEEEPVVIHRASIGAIERTMAFLIEKYKGAFPLWLTPVQVKVLPISEKQIDYAKSIEQKLKSIGLRSELDNRNETLGAKIRDAQKEKIPYMFIVGQKEIDSQKISVRTRDGKDLGQTDFDMFTKILSEKILNKSLEI
jgi:threonyl-tRNA synthetase